MSAELNTISSRICWRKSFISPRVSIAAMTRSRNADFSFAQSIFAVRFGTGTRT